MPQKRRPSPPKPPPSPSSSEEEEQQEESEEEENTNTNTATPVSSQMPKNPTPKGRSLNESSEEGDDENDNEDDEDDSKDENPKSQSKTTLPTEVKEQQDQEKSDEYAESGSDSSSDSDLPPTKSVLVHSSRGADPTIKPISSKPMNGAAKAKKSTMSSPVGAASPPPKPTPRKRATTDTKSNSKNSKKRQKMKDQVAEFDTVTGVGKLEDLYPNLSEFLHSSSIVKISRLEESELREALSSMNRSVVEEWEEKCKKLRSMQRDLCVERAEVVYQMMKECSEMI